MLVPDGVNECPLVGEFPSRGHRLVFDGLERREIEPRNPNDKRRRGYVPKFEIVTDDEPGVVTRKSQLVDRLAERPLHFDHANLAGRGLLALLFLVSSTGLLLLAVRESPLMGVTLVVHLGFVLALFVMLPYGKFVHAIYRFAALLRFHAER